MNNFDKCDWQPLDGNGYGCTQCWAASEKLTKPPKGWTCHYSDPPPLTRQAWNLAASVAAFAADGFRFVSRDEYAVRLAICEPCDRRRDGRCLACGCYLAAKARGRAFKCPMEKWPEVKDG